MTPTDEELFGLLAKMGPVRGTALIDAADAPDVLWNKLAKGAGLSDEQSHSLRAFILRSRRPED